LSASKRPRHAGSIPTGTKSNGAVAARAGGVGATGRITIFPSDPPARGGRLSPTDMWLLDLWLDGCTDAEMAAEMSLRVEEVSTRRRALWVQLQTLNPDDPSPAG
jgi:hypothetical protein